VKRIIDPSEGRGLNKPGLPKLHIRRLRLETQHEPIALMHADCPVAKSEGFAARARVELATIDRSAVATLYYVNDDLLSLQEVGLSESVWWRLGAEEGSEIAARHAQPIASMSHVRAKVYGNRLGAEQLHSIVRDVVAERYSDVELAAFVTAFSSQAPQIGEMVALTKAMIDAGERIRWPNSVVADKHCVGGLPANRTTPIVVAIAAANGLVIPKTSSRAITSPSGTADAMETMAPVDLDTAAMRKVVEAEGGCVVWGGSVGLSPADDILIRVERALDFDCTAQLVASVLSKKLAAGSTHLLLDIPVGPTTKVRTAEEAAGLTDHLAQVAEAFGLRLRTVVTDGRQPVGRGIGPALEARDVLSVLRGSPDGPADLRARAVELSGTLLELAGGARSGTGASIAGDTLESGRALAKFQAICGAQGGFREPPVAPLRHDIEAAHDGLVATIDNRLLGRIAKLAGAPRSQSAGLDLHVKLGDKVTKGQVMVTLHGQSPGELAYALTYAEVNPQFLGITRS
jgi:thymidine phosphorylase